MSNLRQQLIDRKNRLDVEIARSINAFHKDTGLRVDGVQVSSNKSTEGKTYTAISEVRI